jgi:hypothetical protein
VHQRQNSRARRVFKKPNDGLARQLLCEQLEDGGWNCEAVELPAKRPLSRRASFHTTICVLEGLLAYEHAGRKSAALTKACRRGEMYLLDRHLFRSLRTGEVIDERWLRFPFPTFWHFLRGLDYLRNAGVKPDSRIRRAVEMLIKRRHQNGHWPLKLLHRERIPLEMETPVGSASRWNTLRALCVLSWNYKLNVLGVAGTPSLWLRSVAAATLPLRADHGQTEKLSQRLRGPRLAK